MRTDGEQFNAIVNGTTSITVTNDQVLIDVTNGNIRSVTFKQVNNQIAEASSTSWWPKTRHAIWFLIRLVFSIILALVDTVLTIGFLLGQLGFILFGPTGRDVIYGFLVLGAIVIGITAMANA